MRAAAEDPEDVEVREVALGAELRAEERGRERVVGSERRPVDCGCTTARLVDVDCEIRDGRGDRGQDEGRAETAARQAEPAAGVGGGEQRERQVAGRDLRPDRGGAHGELQVRKTEGEKVGVARGRVARQRRVHCRVRNAEVRRSGDEARDVERRVPGHDQLRRAGERERVRDTVRVEHAHRLRVPRAARLVEGNDGVRPVERAGRRSAERVQPERERADRDRQARQRQAPAAQVGLNRRPGARVSRDRGDREPAAVDLEANGAVADGQRLRVQRDRG